MFWRKNLVTEALVLSAQCLSRMFMPAEAFTELNWAILNRFGYRGNRETKTLHSRSLEAEAGILENQDLPGCRKCSSPVCLKNYVCKLTKIKRPGLKFSGWLPCVRSLSSVPGIRTTYFPLKMSDRWKKNKINVSDKPSKGFQWLMPRPHLWASPGYRGSVQDLCHVRIAKPKRTARRMSSNGQYV